MNLRSIEDKLRLRLSSPLPGVIAHDSMRAVPVGELVPKFQHTSNPRPGGVLILLYQDGESIKFPLIRRQEYPGAHSGQISLPGGKSENGENTVDTALRETEEEIGVDRKMPTVIGRLSNFLVIPSNFMITPVVATVSTLPNFLPDPHEVAAVLTARVSDLVHHDAIQVEEILAAGRFRMMAPHFKIDEAIVWGATAMMLNEFRLVLQDIL